ncbi:HD domain-containing protein 2 [Carlito syrichta]|uniref:5'-deoxynucleotidase HDDC2 n=1 Tax=Carlito syrichta TaxID=1868482 RepID=A0A3Q0E863_CARSF|nr:HD domain-containing protein 2 [Carlito syrichta]
MRSEQPVGSTESPGPAGSRGVLGLSPGGFQKEQDALSVAPVGGLPGGLVRNVELGASKEEVKIRIKGGALTGDGIKPLEMLFFLWVQNLEGDPLSKFRAFVGVCCLWRRVPRTGWVYRNVKGPESVSDHMYRMAVMAMVTKDDHLNKDRCVRLALVHDMAECIVGDIAPADNIPKEEKHRREEEAMKQITQLLPEDLRKELYELWEEYETQSTAEARFVKQLDQCEMILQASEYEDLENKPGRLQDFYDSTAGKFSHPEIVQLVSELEAERNANIAAAACEPHS